MNEKGKRSKAALTGLETAIILISFVIVAAAFAFAVPNLGLFATQKSGEVLGAGLEEATSAIETSGSVIARANQAGGSVQNVTVYIKLSVGKKPIDLSAGKLFISYKDPYTAIDNIYTSNSSSLSTGSRVRVKAVNGDGDNLIEFGELWMIQIGISQLSSLKPNDLFGIEIKPSTGSVLKIERRLPPSIDLMMDLT